MLFFGFGGFCPGGPSVSRVSPALQPELCPHHHQAGSMRITAHWIHTRSLQHAQRSRRPLPSAPHTHNPGPQPTGGGRLPERAPAPTPARARARAHPVSLRNRSSACATSAFRVSRLSAHPKASLNSTTKSGKHLVHLWNTMRSITQCPARGRTQKPDTARVTAQAHTGNGPHWPGAFWDPWGGA